MQPISNPPRGRLSVDEAIAWLDATTVCLGAETSPVSGASGRTLAEDVRAGRPVPPVDRAAYDGFAVRADECLGAGAYNPIAIRKIPVASGEALPAGADAVVPRDHAEADSGNYITVIEPVAPGDNIERQGATASQDAVLASCGTRLAARHIGLLALAGVAEVRVIRQPRVRIFVARPPHSVAWDDGNGPMLRAAIERDGGVVDCVATIDRNRNAIQKVLDDGTGGCDTGADIVLVTGGTGAGADDHAPAALAAAGELAVHGIALSPGETTALGRSRSGVPIVLLPGVPASCLWAYEFFAGRAIRRLGGRAGALPYRSENRIAARKIVSAIGTTEICPVRCDSGAIVPLPPFSEIGLAAAAAADGFVVVPESSEGFPQGTRVSVYLYERD
ncbi:MAG TPA: molybdopterin molybdotransferase MoeA [Stellaceae bacterium]|jgi:molybdopterin molybdotransferase|nr:molybdopterin molybdotransferase MoeA [Stellaceae bacterium]